MRRFKYTFIGFILFVLSLGIMLGLGLVLFNYVINFGDFVAAVVMLVYIVVISVLCTIADYIRRKIMIEKPLKEILKATELMTRGNFKINLNINHEFIDYDEYDLIKVDLNRLAKELSKNEVLKTDFIANVSHEIKTPLSVIQNYAKALGDEKLNEETRKKYLLSMQDACKRLSNLVLNILKLNKLENQKLLPEITKFNLSELLANQVVQFEDLIEKKEIELECNIEEDLEINSEESYLEIIINNLMSNALKFTNQKGKISISLIKIDEEYIIRFKDDGCGMDKETGMHIFDKFYQGDTSHSKEGNGLGLALVKKVIDIMGGKINVESELGKGTTFTVIIKEM